MDDTTIEISEVEVKRSPWHEAAIAEFRRKGRIEYGENFQWQEFEAASGVKRKSEQDDGWEFRAVYLRFCDALKEEGYLISQSGMNEEGFRICLREEMADRVNRDMRAQANANLRSSIMLSAAKKDGLPEAEVKKLEHQATRAAYVGAVQKRMLQMRKLPATPEMARKIAQRLEFRREQKEE